jgi:D-aspartate ligase
MRDGTAFIVTHESNPERTKPSMSLQALILTRSLGRRGIPVVRVHPNRNDWSLRSKYCTRIAICPDPYASESEFVEYLVSLAREYPEPRVLIPASDDTAYFFGKHRSELSQYYALCVAGKEVMDRIIDKKQQIRSAQEIGVPVPETHFPDEIDDIGALARRLTNYPYLIKPTIAHRWRLASVRAKLRSGKGVPVRTPEELIREYQRIVKVDCNIMIQEIIPGEDERLFTFLCYFSEASRPLAYCIRSKKRQLPVHFGYCTATVSCHNSVVEAQSIELLRGLSYSGIASVEWKHDPRTSVYKLIEINARAVNTMALAVASGVDIPLIAFRDLSGDPVEPVTDWQDGVLWVWLKQDIWAARALRRAGRLKWSSWLASLRGPRVHAVYAPDDLRPFLGYLSDFVKAQRDSLLRRFSTGPDGLVMRTLRWLEADRD